MKEYIEESGLYQVPNIVQSKVTQDLLVNDHQPFPKSQVQIEKSLISHPLTTDMQIIAFSCFGFFFFP